MYSFPNLEPVCCSMSRSAASWPAYKFFRRQVRWSGIPVSWRIFQFVVLRTVKGFGIVNKAVDIFLELSCFFYDPADVGNLVSCSSAFSKTSLNNWKFTVHVLLKPGFENFEHYFTSMWDECNCAVVWALGVELGYLFDFFLFSQGNPVLLWTFPLALFLQCSIGFGLCFNFQSFLCISWFFF